MIRETITLNQKEQHRVHILTRLQGGILRAAEAASLLGLSVRHLRRLLARFRRHGAAAVSHGNRGRPSHRRRPPRPAGRPRRARAAPPPPPPRPPSGAREYSATQVHRQWARRIEL